MFTYVCLGADDPASLVPFYDAVLGALGLRRCRADDAADDDTWFGWGVYEDHGQREVALWLCRPFDGAAASPGNGTMIAFAARSWVQVDGFHAAALAHGGRSEGAPGLRLQYNPDFYAAYVRDPAGHKLAAVCRGFVQRPDD